MKKHIRDYSYRLDAYVPILGSLFEQADYILAHNAGFEQSFLAQIPAMQKY